MPVTLVDNVKIYSKSTGTGAIVLGSPVPAYRGVEALTNGQIYSYSIQQGANYEYGRGTYLASGQQLVRSPIASSTGGTALDLQPNAEIALVALAEDIADYAAAAGGSAGAVAAENWAEGAGEPGGVGTGTKSAKGWVNYLLANTSFIAIAADLALGATSKIVAVATDLLLGATSKIATVANDLALGASSLIGQAPAAATLAGHYANDASNADVPGGSPGDRGAKYWSLQAASFGNALKTRSPLMKIGAVTGTPAYVWPDSTGAYVLGQANADGKWYIDLHPDSPAASLITTKVSAAILAGGFVDKSSLARLFGTSGGSPSMDAALLVARDSAGNPMFGVGTDLTFWIGKYDSRIMKAVNAAERIEQGPVPIIDTGNIVLLYGSGRRTIWSTGTAANARFGTNGGFTFTDKLRGLDIPYSIALDGTVRAVQSDTAYDVYTASGHSGLAGQFAATTPDTIAPYPGRYLMLTGGPVLMPSGRSGSAVFLDGRESNSNGTGLTAFASQRLANMTSRPAAKLVAFGSATSGSRSITDPTAGLDTGTPVAIDLKASLDRTVALVGGAIRYDGPVCVRAHILIHGDGVTDTGYGAAIVAYQANHEAMAKTATGRFEPVPFFLNQTATQQKFAVTDSLPVANYVGHLQQLAASRSGAKIFLVGPDYIYSFTDDQHPDTASQYLRGQKFEQAIRTVVDRGLDWVGVRPRPVAEWTIGSTTIDVPFDVQVAPLVIDTALCTDPGNSGFQWTDSNSRTISSVAVLPDGKTVRVTFSGAIGATWTLSYADTNGTSGKSGKTAGARGCLRDSDPALARDGSTHLYNAGVSFRQANP